jgi:UDP-2,3-diacylglucosamine hydrolase
MNRQWFISDLHLAEERPDTLLLFERFLAEYPRPGDRVFILGDLFDVWIGDDDDSTIADRIRADLLGLTQRNIELWVQQGNRDFAMGRRLMRDIGATLLPDTYVTDVAGEPTLLMHGDLLCTDDVEYQKARRRFRNPIFQWLMLRKSLDERRRIADDIRRRSRERKALKAENIMDVNADTVVTYLQRHRVRQLIHGHTHRPARHAMRLPDGTEAMRLVLPEWQPDSAAAWVDDGTALHRVVVAGD